MPLRMTLSEPNEDVARRYSAGADFSLSECVHTAVMEQIPVWFSTWPTRRSVGVTKFYTGCLDLCRQFLGKWKVPLCGQHIPTRSIK
jgi:hypothetical protein